MELSLHRDSHAHQAETLQKEASSTWGLLLLSVTAQNYSHLLELTGASSPTPSLSPKLCIIFSHHKDAN